MLRGEREIIYFRKRKRVLKRLLAVGLLFFVAYAFYSFSRFLLPGVFKASWINEPVFQLFILVFVIALLFKPVDHFIFFLFKYFIFRRKDQHFDMLSKLSHDIASILDLHELSNLVVNTVGEALHVRTVALMVYQQQEGAYTVVSAYGMNPAHYRKIHFAVECPLIDTLRTFAVPLVREQIRKLLPWQEANQLTNEFELLQASCIIPIVHEEQLIGSLSLGARSASEYFRKTDIRFFEDFAKDIASSIRNAIMMEELKRANEELKKVQAELIQSTQLSAIEQLATGLAHEIHNPLTIISGKAQVLLLKKDKKVYDEQVEEVLKTIVKQTKRAADITRKLLMFSQDRTSAIEPVSFEAIVNDTVALISYQMTLDDIRVIKQIDRDLPVFHANSSAFREVFLILLLNAVQAIGKSGEIHIRVRYKPLDQTIEIRVADTGVGIDEKNLSQIFNPFFTTRPDGTGLGLFITQQIIHRYHGSIRAESKVGEGTAVIIRLPLDKNGASKKAAVVQDSESPKPELQVGEAR